MRLLVVSTPNGNCFAPEFGASMRRVPAAPILMPSPHSRRERLIFLRRPPQAEVRLGGCTFVRRGRKSRTPSIIWDDPYTSSRFMPPRGPGLAASGFAIGDEIRILLHPKYKERAIRNFWFCYWNHIAGGTGTAKERLYH